MSDSCSLTPLPAPSVEVQLGFKNVRWTPELVRAFRCNPLYAGIGPLPARMSDEKWVRSAAEVIRDDGAEQFLVNLLYVLRSSFQLASDADSPEKLDKRSADYELEVKDVQRVFKIAPRFEAIDALLADDIHSAASLFGLNEEECESDDESDDEKSRPEGC